MISLKKLSLIKLVILLGAGCAGHAFGQQPPLAIKPIRPSQKASVMQTIGVTDITITYSRPPVKERTIFADAPATMESRAKGEATLDNQNERKAGEPIVPYNHVWRAGANEARDVIDGQRRFGKEQRGLEHVHRPRPKLQFDVHAGLEGLLRRARRLPCRRVSTGRGPSPPWTHACREAKRRLLCRQSAER